MQVEAKKTQDAGTAYETPEELLRAVGLYEWTQATFADALKARPPQKIIQVCFLPKQAGWAVGYRWVG